MKPQAQPSQTHKAKSIRPAATYSLQTLKVLHLGILFHTEKKLAGLCAMTEGLLINQLKRRPDITEYIISNDSTEIEILKAEHLIAAVHNKIYTFIAIEMNSAHFKIKTHLPFYKKNYYQYAHQIIKTPLSSRLLNIIHRLTTKRNSEPAPVISDSQNRLLHEPIPFKLPRPPLSNKEEIDLLQDIIKEPLSSISTDLLSFDPPPTKTPAAPYCKSSTNKQSKPVKKASSMKKTKPDVNREKKTPAKKRIASIPKKRPSPCKTSQSKKPRRSKIPKITADTIQLPALPLNLSTSLADNTPAHVIPPKKTTTTITATSPATTPSSPVVQQTSLMVTHNNTPLNATCMTPPKTLLLHNHSQLYSPTSTPQTTNSQTHELPCHQNDSTEPSTPGAKAPFIRPSSCNTVKHRSSPLLFSNRLTSTSTPRPLITPIGPASQCNAALPYPQSNAPTSIQSTTPSPHHRGLRARLPLSSSQAHVFHCKVLHQAQILQQHITRSQTELNHLLFILTRSSIRYSAVSNRVPALNPSQLVPTDVKGSTATDSIFHNNRRQLNEFNKVCLNSHNNVIHVQPVNGDTMSKEIKRQHPA